MEEGGGNVSGAAQKKTKREKAITSTMSKHVAFKLKEDKATIENSTFDNEAMAYIVSLVNIHATAAVIVSGTVGNTTTSANSTVTASPSENLLKETK